MGAEYMSWASSLSVEATMRGNRRRDTKPELAVRRLLHAQGLRYRVDARPVPALNRRADILFTRAKVAVMIDGCYWHGCPEHGTAATVNAEYWRSKIAGNVARDEETNRLLNDAGWTVIRAWEHESPEDVAGRIVAMVRDGDEGLA